MKQGVISFLLAGMLSYGVGLQAAETKLGVRHDHTFRSCQGVLIFSGTGVEYQTDHKKHARTWKYEDIQQLGLLGPKEVSILTYEDSKWLLGKDRGFRFEANAGEITASLWAELQSKLTRPLVSSLIPPGIVPSFAIPVKHEQSIVGTHGTLEISDHYIIYRTTTPKDSRIWRYEDITSIGTTGAYQLRLTVPDRMKGELGGDRNFVFTLKQRLKPEIYDFIWWKINGPQISSFTKRVSPNATGPN